MNAIIRKKTTDGTKEYPCIYIIQFNGNYKNSFFALSVNDTLVFAESIESPRGRFISTWSSLQDKQIVDTYRYDIEKYVLRFIESHSCERFDEPLGTICYRINNYQFELLNYENKNGKKAVSFLVNGAFAIAEETDDGESIKLVAKANGDLLNSILPEITFFADKIFKNSDGKEVLNE